MHTFEEKKPTKWIKQVKKYMIDLHYTQLNTQNINTLEEE